LQSPSLYITSVLHVTTLKPILLIIHKFCKVCNVSMEAESETAVVVIEVGEDERWDKVSVTFIAIGFSAMSSSQMKLFASNLYTDRHCHTMVTGGS